MIPADAFTADALSRSSDDFGSEPGVELEEASVTVDCLRTDCVRTRSARMGLITLESLLRRDSDSDSDSDSCRDGGAEAEDEEHVALLAAISMDAERLRCLLDRRDDADVDEDCCDDDFTASVQAARARARGDAPQPPPSPVPSGATCDSVAEAEPSLEELLARAPRPHGHSRRSVQISTRGARERAFSRRRGAAWPSGAARWRRF